MHRAPSMPVDSPKMPRPGFDHADRPAAYWRRSASLAAVASGALLLGVLVYLTDRSASSATMIPRVQALASHHVFGTIGQWLPSFVHPLAFSLFTAAAMPARAAPRYGACVAWAAVNLAFEVGQHAAIRETLAGALYGVIGHAPPVHWLANYFLRGTFDIGDMVVICLGSLAAAAVLSLTQARLE